MPAEPIPSIEARRACILVVDDEPLVAAVLADTLMVIGYEVETAKNGREALEKIAARSYDLIVSDLRMPELDGMDLITSLNGTHRGCCSGLSS
jgi:CheY-like chemotaxis protein